MIYPFIPAHLVRDPGVPLVRVLRHHPADEAAHPRLAPPHVQGAVRRLQQVRRVVVHVPEDRAGSRRWQINILKMFNLPMQ